VKEVVEFKKEMFNIRIIVIVIIIDESIIFYDRVEYNLGNFWELKKKTASALLYAYICSI